MIKNHKIILEIYLKKKNNEKSSQNSLNTNRVSEENNSIVETIAVKNENEKEEINNVYSKESNEKLTLNNKLNTLDHKNKKNDINLLVSNNLESVTNRNLINTNVKKKFQFLKTIKKKY